MMLRPSSSTVSRRFAWHWGGSTKLPQVWSAHSRSPPTPRACGSAWRPSNSVAANTSTPAVPSNASSPSSPDSPRPAQSSGHHPPAMWPPDRAAECYRAALRLNPDYAETHSNLAAALAMLGEYDGALSHACTAIALRPDYPGPYVHAAFAEADRGHCDAALAWIEQIAASASGNAAIALAHAECSANSTASRNVRPATRRLLSIRNRTVPITVWAWPSMLWGATARRSPRSIGRSLSRPAPLSQSPTRPMC